MKKQLRSGCDSTLMLKATRGIRMEMQIGSRGLDGRRTRCRNLLSEAAQFAHTCSHVSDWQTQHPGFPQVGLACLREAAKDPVHCGILPKKDEEMKCGKLTLSLEADTRTCAAQCSSVFLYQPQWQACLRSPCHCVAELASCALAW